MGFMDERGCFRITDRKKDMIIVSGFKVFPNQAEDVVAMRSDVAEVAAIGVPDERSGEVETISVVKENAALTEAALLAHCRPHLTRCKVPKTNLGKNLRRAVAHDSRAGFGSRRGGD